MIPKQQVDSSLHKLEKLFDKFLKTRNWERLPGLQKGLMLRRMQESRNCEETAKELYGFLEKMIASKPKLILRSR